MRFSDTGAAPPIQAPAEAKPAAPARSPAPAADAGAVEALRKDLAETKEQLLEYKAIVGDGEGPNGTRAMAAQLGSLKEINKKLARELAEEKVRSLAALESVERLTAECAGLKTSISTVNAKLEALDAPGPSTPQVWKAHPQGETSGPDPIGDHSAHPCCLRWPPVRPFRRMAGTPEGPLRFRPYLTHRFLEHPR